MVWFHYQRNYVRVKYLRTVKDGLVAQKCTAWDVSQKITATSFGWNQTRNEKIIPIQLISQFYIVIN